MAESRPSFPVCLSSALASRLAVDREMLLNLEGEHLTLVGLNGIYSWTWNIRHLRNYGYKRDDFHFEAGKRCQTGVGYFSFYTPQGKEIFRVLNQMKGEYKRRNFKQPNRVAETNLPSPRKISMKLKFLSLLPRRKPKEKKSDRFEEAKNEETSSLQEQKRSSVVSAAYVTILPETPSGSNSASENKHQTDRSMKKRFRAGDAWKHHGY
ncbi:fibroblast growth factor receptor substrate 3-like isoform X2 [Penaeus indicus]|uniref:fibroblast growth factor receptor substrate 3-like isoform X2 n=1 Tax=Penaeus indicus TaxID=29960 RepID=UPI00300C3DED